MKPANASAIPLDMEQARQELEAWRSTHRPRCHIPDSSWKRAAELASQHGLYFDLTYLARGLHAFEV
jgi:hypothetical protein